MWTDNAHVDDILRLFISANKAPMTGVFSFAGHVDIPGGPEPFLQRLKLVADFGVGRGKFMNAKTERDLTRLSDSSEKRHAEATEQTSGDVLSNLRGHGAAANGMATLSDVFFAIPGASARLHGTYGLIGYRVNLHGSLLTTGNPSDAATGFKSFMMKVVTPFLKRKHSAKVVPFKITGSYSNIDVSLDLPGRAR
jgi:hypothetical protein